MKKILLILVLFSTSLFAEKSENRIISLAPSITEILCALDLQNEIVGVTDFCKDPYKQSDFSNKSIGGLINPNFEAMLKFRPSVIFTLKSKANHTSKLKKYGLNVIELDHHNLPGVFKSIQVIGKKCGKADQANALYEKLNSLLVDKDTANGKRVLITISRLSSKSKVRLWVAGNDGYYSKILNLCGAKNAYQASERFSQITLEALIKINPDVILLIRDPVSEEEALAEKKEWQKFSTIEAIKNDDFHIITGDEVMIPGPRFPKLLKKFQKILIK
ncbi:MAG: helical backbone metal receptor [Lentisphaeraceae bacterium]|nr:helical backbone metal receptor [Lentisphaeraceae bacterium]